MYRHARIILYIVLVAVITVSAYILFVVIPSRLAENTYSGARRIADDIRKAFQLTPEVTVNNSVIIEQETEILELALVAQKYRHNYNWTNQWMGSKKTITVSGSFEAKAGFDLQKRFVLEINDNIATVKLPRASLLSVEVLNDIQYRDEGGVWNWVNDEERSKALNAFTQNARQFADRPDFKQKAEKELERRLTEIMKGHGKQVVFQYEETIKKN